jgi:uncharacterized damage-inducible protein DinB
MQLSSSLTTRMHYQHKTIVEIIDGLTDEQIRRTIWQGKWSMFEIIVHLQTYQHTFVQRVKEILTGNNPEFSRYTAEADPLFLDNCTKSAREVMHDLLTVRKEMTAEILNFPEVDYDKKGIHPAFGSMNLSQWINFFLVHEGHHLFILFKMAAELKKLSQTV